MKKVIRLQMRKEEEEKKKWERWKDREKNMKNL
jgi:hypothetical protein